MLMVTNQAIGPSKNKGGYDPLELVLPNALPYGIRPIDDVDIAIIR